MNDLKRAYEVTEMLDDELKGFVTAALARYTATTQADDYVRPPDYTPKPRVVFKPPVYKGPPTVAQADAWAQEYEDYRATHKQPVSPQELHALWHQEYAGQFAEVPEPMPLADMSVLNLSRTAWHDVMYRACKIRDRDMQSGKSKNFYPPYELLLHLAKKSAKHAKDLQFRHFKTERLRRLGQLRDQPDDDDLPDAYPRTYL